MEDAEQWEDASARGEAMRRRVAVAEEQPAVERGSPGKAVAIDHPEAHQDIDDDDIETWDIFAPIEIVEGLRARPKKKPIPLDAEALKAQELAREKYRADQRSVRNLMKSGGRIVTPSALLSSAVNGTLYIPAGTVLSKPTVSSRVIYLHTYIHI
jgi:hypothetical protein